MSVIHKVNKKIAIEYKNNMREFVGKLYKFLHGEK